MSGRAKLVYCLVYCAILVFPGSFVRGLAPNAASWVAWAIISVYLTGLLALFAMIFTDRAPVRKAEPAKKRMSWRSMMLGSAVIWLVITPFSTAILLGEHGFGVFATSSYYVGFGVLAVVLVGVGVLARANEVTRAGVAAKVTARRRRRHGRARDAALLATFAGDERQTALKVVRARAVRQATVRRSLAIPLAPIAAWAVVEELDFLPGPVLWLWAATALALLIGVIFATVRRDPLLLFGRVTGGLYGVERSAGEQTHLRELVYSFAVNGSFRTVTVDARAAFRVTPDGRLRPDQSRRGVREVGATHRTFKHNIQGENAVLICAANGLVIGQFSDLL
jgi:MFS family permease